MASEAIMASESVGGNMHMDTSSTGTALCPSKGTLELHEKRTNFLKKGA